MAWYDLNEEKETKKDYLQRVKYEKILCRRTKNFTDIIGDDLSPNVQYRLVTEKSFNAIVVLEYLLKRYELIEIYMAVYRMNQLSVNRLKSIIDSGRIKCSILLSSFFRENKKYERWAENLIQYADRKENVKVAFALNHAKVFIAKTKDNRHIVFEGSGNLSDNARIEQYMIEDNELTYNFHKEWIANTINSSEQWNKQSEQWNKQSEQWK
jgi:hypothetical protein